MKKKKNKNSCVTFFEAAEMWLAYTKLHVKQSTYENYVFLLNKHIYPYFKSISMKGLTCNIINRFKTEKLSSGRLKQKYGVSKKYLQDMISIIKSIANFAEQEYGIGNKIRYMRGLKIEKPDMRILAKTEQKKLTDNLMNNIVPQKIGILLSLYTGMRIGEICGLKWKDFDSKEGVISVKRTVQRISDNNGSTILIEGTPKTQASQRLIPIPKFLCKILNQFKRSDEQPIISHNSQYTEPAKLRKYFKKILKECNIRDMRFHELRHTFASYCVQLKFDIKTLSEILGHTNVSMTLNRYVHSSINIKRHYMELIEI